jgi:2-methylisocitrate lyase-like PEP mutase family enzyme
MSANISRAARLRELLASGQVLTVPGCYDAISAKLVERAGFPCTFMTGFGVAAVRGYPDTQLITYSEMRDSVQDICDSLTSTVVIGDGDTGYGNALNVKRTVPTFACL